MRNRKGMLVPLMRRAEAIADYLEQEHWQNKPRDGQDRSINRGFLRIITGIKEQDSKKRQTLPFTEEELEDAIKLTKKGK